MLLKTKLFGTVYQFKSLNEVMAKANEERSGDKLAGLAAASITEMIAAKEVLSNLTLKDIRNNPAVPYEKDEVTRIIQDGVNEKIYGEIQNWTVAELREWILNSETTSSDIRRISRGLTSEMVAAVAKLMSNLDLVYGAKKIIVTAHCNTTIGQAGTLAYRLQPNHTTDNIEGIKISLYEGLSYGVGDAVLGLNPVNDTVNSVKNVLKLFEEVKQQWQIPTQTCVLAHVTTQMEAIRQGAPSDLIFQSIAGTEKGNEAFGVSDSILSEARELVLKEGTSTGPNVMYFETGQGSELSSDAHMGVDQVTLEARCYGLAKKYQPFLVNTVVGFIGPEYLYDSKQVIRAGLEDHFMGKLSGIPMGVDVCYTNHMKADQNDVENLSVLLASAGCNFLIGTPAGDDIMLNYQSSSFHDAPTLRELLNLTPIPEFQQWLEKVGVYENGRLSKRAGDASIFFSK
ncbi:ethanolamine ammonia-lyase subunit EutB [Clostridium formicaceticum]|uniref:Ethanolamine ammonia-lyase large subunit n=1 Tax=Clostridium formicaceticum TaxID=1497 RepID=A0AAC9WEU7_9CLOT|nr:ethanolamine ammonia-lyase subunit EutB [Clostridium formicaceticum]AOY75788.1 ethanolamine ammonia-lyase [Clostridium formicaceticum]ARE86116.1 Ethanolamine ammonia-lyase heavy chain [Clostridium formicaceticum]